MAVLVFSFPATFASIDYGAVGGCILLLDLVFFLTVASFWDVAKSSGHQTRKGR